MDPGTILDRFPKLDDEDIVPMTKLEAKLDRMEKSGWKLHSVKIWRTSYLRFRILRTKDGVTESRAYFWATGGHQRWRNA